jgi:hypothetical protein
MAQPHGLAARLEELLGRNAELNAALFSALTGIGALLIFLFTPVTDSTSDPSFRAAGCTTVVEKIACVAQPNLVAFGMVVLPFFAVPVVAALLHTRRRSRKARVVLYAWSLLWGLYVGLTSIAGIGLIYLPSAALALVASIIAGRPEEPPGGARRPTQP